MHSRSNAVITYIFMTRKARRLIYFRINSRKSGDVLLKYEYIKYSRVNFKTLRPLIFGSTFLLCVYKILRK